MTNIQLFLKNILLKRIVVSFFFSTIIFFNSFTQENSLLDTLKKANNSNQVDVLITYAKKYLGTPYRSAGTTPSGFDCSGFISFVFSNFGIPLVHSSYGMAEFGETVKLADIRPGDLMFFKGRNVNSSRIGHVAMVVDVKEDGIYFIHSSSSNGVIINNFKTSKYYIARYVTTKRLDFGQKFQKK
ncbi:MAG: C40 family peptidase [Flavobacteriia bacterium]|nr:C40 family peptidase [Flavobacteriia bacterium]